MGDDSVQPLPLKLQQSDLPFQSLHGIKVRAVQDIPNILQRKPQLPEQQDAVKPSQGFFVIQPLACFRHPGGLQQADGVIVVQRAHTHSRHTADFFHGFHMHPSP